MKKSGALLLLMLPLILPPDVQGQDTRAGRFDNGRMWTFDYPPADYLENTYGFSPGEAWFQHARLGSLRLPNCTASFVSPAGLVMTNHHCARGSVNRVAGESEDLLHDGFVSASLVDERNVSGLYADQLIAIDDVTAEVLASTDAAETDAEKAAARQEAIEIIKERLSGQVIVDAGSVVVEVVNLYNGGRYSAYTFRRFADVRLVMAPELQLGYFGGDTDNFTYPRYALDMSFFRIYVEGEPYQPDHYFQWSSIGASEGDAVFVVGNPGSTLRLETMAQLEWRRDVQEKAILALLESRIVALQNYYDEQPSSGLLNQIFSLKNARKLYAGRVNGLNDPEVMARRADTQRQFVEDLDSLRAATASGDIPLEYVTVIDELAELQRQKRELAAEYSAFLAMQPGGNLASSTLGRALLARTYLQREAAGAPTEELTSLKQQIDDINQDPAIDLLILEARLTDFVQYLGRDDSLVINALGEHTPAEVTARIADSSIFHNPDGLVSALEAGSVSPNDPALALANTIAERRADFQSALAGLSARETELNAEHGRARFAVYGTTRPPDATFSLRIADGVVDGYNYNGTEAPAFTTYSGMYDRYHSYKAAGDAGEWTLPHRWVNPPESFDRSTQLNLVSTNDIIGGNSGSPLLNRDLEVVGLIFDGNIESLPSAFIYRTEAARAVSVDVRGMKEALDEIYDADRLILELTTGQLVATEDEADAILEQAQ